MSDQLTFVLPLAMPVEPTAAEAIAALLPYSELAESYERARAATGDTARLAESVFHAEIQRRDSPVCRVGNQGFQRHDDGLDGICKRCGSKVPRMEKL